MISDFGCVNIVNYLNNKKLVFQKKEKDGSIRFYVNKKVFAVLYKKESVELLSLRLDPKLSPLLRKNKYIFPSFYYMNPFHWSSFIINSFHEDTLFELIDLSYNLSVEKMTKKRKFEYNNIHRFV